MFLQFLCVEITFMVHASFEINFAGFITSKEEKNEIIRKITLKNFEKK